MYCEPHTSPSVLANDAHRYRRAIFVARTDKSSTNFGSSRYPSDAAFAHRTPHRPSVQRPTAMTFPSPVINNEWSSGVSRRRSLVAQTLDALREVRHLLITSQVRIRVEHAELIAVGQTPSVHVRLRSAGVGADGNEWKCIATMAVTSGSPPNAEPSAPPPFFRKRDATRGEQALFSASSACSLSSASFSSNGPIVRQLQPQEYRPPS